MANFALIRALGWALKSKLLHSEMAQIDSDRTKAPNFAEGSSHISTGQVILHGLGAEITPLVSTDADLTIGSGHKVDFLSGANLYFESGSTGTVKSGATFDAKDGSTTLFEGGAGGGSSVGLAGKTLVADFGFGGTNGIVTIGSAIFGVGSIVLSAFGQIIAQSGSVVRLFPGSALSDSGSTSTISGSSGNVAAWTWGDYSTLDIGGTGIHGAIVSLNPNGHFNIAGGAGAWSSGTITDTGLTYNKSGGTWTLSGTGAINLSGTTALTVGSTAKLLFTAGGAIQETALLTGTFPAKNADPGKNPLSGALTTKAWAHCTITTGVVTIDDGINIASGAVDVNGSLVLTYAHAMTSAFCEGSASCPNPFSMATVDALTTTTVTASAWGLDHVTPMAPTFINLTLAVGLKMTVRVMARSMT